MKAVTEDYGFEETTENCQWNMCTDTRHESYVKVIAPEGRRLGLHTLHAMQMAFDMKAALEKVEASLLGAAHDLKKAGNLAASDYYNNEAKTVRVILFQAKHGKDHPGHLKVT